MGGLQARRRQRARTEALAPASIQFIDMLQEGRSGSEAGNHGQSRARLAASSRLWEKAHRVIQAPGWRTKFPAIEKRRQHPESGTFSGGQPDAGPASAAISGLLGPLSSLMGS